MRKWRTTKTLIITIHDTTLTIRCLPPAAKLAEIDLNHPDSLQQLTTVLKQEGHNTKWTTSHQSAASFSS